jgi:hypothetical protein
MGFFNLRWLIVKYLVALFFVSTSIIPCLEASSITSGFYVGFSSGLEHLGGDRSENLIGGDGLQSQTFTNKKSMNNNGPLVDIFSGYLFRFNSFAMGGEIFYGTSRVQDKLKFNWIDSPDGAGYQGQYNATVEKKFFFGLHVRLGGILYEKLFLYALIGSGTYQLQYSTQQQIYDPALLSTASTLNTSQFSARNLVYTLDYGIGADYQVGRIRLGVAGYISYSKSAFSAFPFDQSAYGSLPAVQASIKPFNSILKLRVSFNF